MRLLPLKRHKLEATLCTKLVRTCAWQAVRKQGFGTLHVACVLDQEHIQK